MEEIEVVCPRCGNVYKLTIIEQIPGYRFPSDEICPYCGEKVRTSMEYEFFTEL